MDTTDEGSEHSNDSSASFWDSTELTAYYGRLVAMATAIPVQPPADDIDELTGIQWVRKVLQDPKRCKIHFCMYPDAFCQLHDILVQNHGLQSTGEFSSVEGLAMFLWGVGTRQCQRQMSDRFRRGLGTVSDKFGEVLECVASFADAVLRPKDAHYRTVHERLEKHTPFCDGCIGALDGTHIRVCVDRKAHDDFTNRKGWTSQNVIAVCDFDMRFTFVGVGKAGAVHGMKVLRDAWAV